MQPLPQMRIGVAVVTFGAENYIAGCLESLIASGYENLRIVVLDNASPDRTAEAVRAWTTGHKPFRAPADWPLHPDRPVDKPLPFAETIVGNGTPEPNDATVTLARSPTNGGFARGVNQALRILATDPSIESFWILNPDTIVEPQTPLSFARKARSMGRFGIIGGRVLFLEAPGRIQADAGRLHPLAYTGVSVNQAAPAIDTPMPEEDDVDYIPGVSLLVSREFIEQAGPMDESYFLYFEEIDWQLRRGDLPIGLEAQARVLHRAGAAIGSAGWNRPPSPLSVYFTCRNLLPFVWRWSPWRLPLAYSMAWVKLVRHYGSSPQQVSAFLRGLHRLGPPPEVLNLLPAAVWRDVLGRSEVTPAGSSGKLTS